MSTGVTAAAGFRATGVAAGLKSSGAPDVAVVVNDGPAAAAAGVFTRNRVVAAPVLWTRQVLSSGRVTAVVLNSGGANACTGPDGFADTHRTAEHVASALSAASTREYAPGEVAVCSTGLIGVRLDLPRLLAGVDRAVEVLDPIGGAAAASAIMTTDTVSKQAHRTHPDGWTVGGMAKGAGMLAPGLATMLVVVTTDVDLDAESLDVALRHATSVTFDRLDSDGCMSTNDTVLLLASGATGATPDVATFTAVLTDVCADLARQLLTDAEGSSKDVAVTVVNAASEADALTVARSVARNNLLKCALAGNDPNWGRIVAAVGTTDAAFDGLDLDVTVNGVQVCRSSAPGDSRDLVDLTGRDVDITVDLKVGVARATIWTNDLTAAYVHENSAYST